MLQETQIDGCIFFTDHGMDDEWRGDPDQYWAMMEQVEAMKRGLVEPVCTCMRLWSEADLAREASWV